MNKNIETVMARIILPGIEDFGSLKERNGFYINKTQFITDWWESGYPYTLITRPRRFGKSLMIRIIEHFFRPVSEIRKTYSKI